MKHLILCVGMALCIFNLANGQTTKELKEVVVQQIKDTFSVNALDQHFTKKELQAIPLEDVGVITQKIAGISLKNYGGLGGLKTISFRGISGNHTVVLLNEFALNNQQMGQVDLGSIQTENVENIRFSTISKSDFIYPISALVSANVLAIQTFENSFVGKNNQLRFSFKMGSFNQFDNYLSIKKITNNKLYSIYGKHRSFDGKYPFTYLNGTNVIEGNRNNNDLTEWNAGAHFAILKENIRWNMAYHFYQSDKGLPGAVIFYNDLASQRLNSQNHFVNIERIECKEQFNSKLYTSFQSNQIKYIDPSYLNMQGELKQNYLNNSFVLGDVFTKKHSDTSYNYFGGVEYQLHFLKTENTTISYLPIRNVGIFVLGINLNKKRFNYQFQFNNHQVVTSQGQSNTYQSFFTGNLYIQKNTPIRNTSIPHLQLKRTMRIPTFGELFINTIYAKEIKPEVVNQIDLGSSIFLRNYKIGVDLYLNVIENKIVAIPTKNLFLWSVQNLGKVFSKGLDVTLERTFFNESKTNLSLKVNYSYQSVLDYSSKNSASYKQQVAYIPQHTSTLDLNLEMNKRVSFHWSTTLLSNRYSLNENTQSNVVEGFSTSDLSFVSIFKLKNKSEIKVNGAVKNVFNSSYQYIRYYVMPGRNYILSISYAF